MVIHHSEKRARFRALHREGCFVLPNPWDIASARKLEELGFAALGTANAGYRGASGRADASSSRDELLDDVRALCEATDLPISADFEIGYADNPDDVYENVLMAIETGVAGLSIEDRDGWGLRPLPVAVERIRAARCAIDRSGADVLLVGRSEGYVIGRPDFEDTLSRLVAYAEAGADCLYAPGLSALPDLAHIVAVVRPKPVNVMIASAGPVVDLAAIGVRRVSVGGSLATAIWRDFDAAAHMVPIAERSSPSPGRGLEWFRQLGGL